MDISGIPNAPEQFEHRINIISPGYTTRRVSVELKKNTIADAGTIELTPGTKVAGHVLDSSENPIEGAKVATFHFTNHPVTTDETGYFEIDGLDPAWQTYSLQSEHPDYPSAHVRFSPLKAGEIVYKDIVMIKGITVHGQITDTNGNPIRNVAIGNTTSRCMWNLIDDKTDENGYYSLENIPSGELTIWAINNSYAPYVQKFEAVDGTSDMVLDIQLDNPVPLHGQVTDSAGNPVSGALVVIFEYERVTNISRKRIKTDSEGKFTIANAPAEGQLKIQVFGADISSAMPILDMGQDFYPIEVERAGKIYGKVIDYDTEQPVTNFTVKMNFSKVGEASGGYAATWSRQGHTFSSDQGFFDTGTEDIAVGSQYCMTVYAAGYEPYMLDPVQVQPVSDDPDRTVFALIPEKLIEGYVTDCNNLPISDVRLRWLTVNEDNKHWDDRQTAISNNDGHFSIPAGGNDTLALYISAKEYSPEIILIDDLPYNDEEQLEFTLQKAPTLYGTLTDENNNPIANGTINIEINYKEKLSNSGINLWAIHSYNTTTDLDGYYEIFDLPVGDIRVIVSYPKEYDRTLNIDRTLKAGQKYQLDISPQIADKDIKPSEILRMFEEENNQQNN